MNARGCCGASRGRACAAPSAASSAMRSARTCSTPTACSVSLGPELRGGGVEGGARRGAGPQRWAGHERVRPSGQGRGGVGTGQGNVAGLPGELLGARGGARRCNGWGGRASDKLNAKWGLTERQRFPLRKKWVRLGRLGDGRALRVGGRKGRGRKGSWRREGIQREGTRVDWRVGWRDSNTEWV